MEKFRPVGHKSFYTHAEHLKYVDMDDIGAATKTLTCPGDGLLHLAYQWVPGHPGRWHSAELFSQNTSHEGFAQQFGYFEVRMKLPHPFSDKLRPFVAVWAWSRESENLTSDYAGKTYTEFDVTEAFLHATTDGTQASAAHYWPGHPKTTLSNPLADRHTFTLSPLQNYIVADDNFHSYGLLKMANRLCAYRDHLLLACFRSASNIWNQSYGLNIDGNIYFSPAGAELLQTRYEVLVDYAAAYPLPHQN